jgi:hypothetical protein
MPAKKRRVSGSAFQKVQQQARALLAALRTEIRAKEAELKQLKQEEAALGRLSGGAMRTSANGRELRLRSGRGAGRIDWRAILHQMPKQFRASDIRGVSSVRNKRPSEIFAAITRWIESGTVKRKTRGVYERA